MRPGVLVWIVAAAIAGAEERQVLKPSEGTQGVSRRLEDGSYLLKAGTKIPLSLSNSISSKNAAPGDGVYLQTLIPIAVDGRIVIPAGTYVNGTVTNARRPGKVKGKGELAIRFDTLMFASGTAVDLNGKIGALDGDNPGDLDRKEDKVSSQGSEMRDAMVVGGASLAGAAMGNWIGDSGLNSGIGAASGAAAGLGAVLFTRGPEATLRRGSTVEMVLNRDLRLNAPGDSVGRPPRQRR